MSNAAERFAEWWERAGRLIGGDRKLAEAAWTAAFGQSTNYVASDVEAPTSIEFANGRVVSIKWASDGSASLGVALAAPPAWVGAEAPDDITTTRGLAHAHLGDCEGEHTKACDMLTLEFAGLFRQIAAGTRGR